MSHFTIKQLEALAALEQGGATPETVQDGSRHETFRVPPPIRSDIRQEIYTLLMLRNEWMSRAEIAQGVGRKKATWIGTLLNQMVTDGYLILYTEERPGTLPKFWYAVRREQG